MNRGRRRKRILRRAGLLALVLGLAPQTMLQASDFDVFDINEGELHFLTSPPEHTPHHHSTHIQITDDSLRNGWVLNKQCHYDLGIIPAMEIVFRAGRVRNLDVVRAEHIKRAWIDRHTVQLEGIEDQAVVCITAETRSLKRNETGREWEWRGGPYLRRFLDGYFPMRVSLAIDYPADRLQLDGLEPAAIRLRSTDLPGHLRLNVLFEGRLSIIARFRKMSSVNGNNGHTPSYPWPD